MQVRSVRSVWHFAYDAEIGSLDIESALSLFGCSFTAKGADNKIVGQVEKGIIQNAIHSLKQSDYVAYCWGMYAYAPTNTISLNELVALSGYVHQAYMQSRKKDPLKGLDEAGKKAKIWELQALAYVALKMASRQDVNDVEPSNKDAAVEMRKVTGVSIAPEDFYQRYRCPYSDCKVIALDLAPRALHSVFDLLRDYLMPVSHDIEKIEEISL